MAEPGRPVPSLGPRQERARLEAFGVTVVEAVVRHIEHDDDTSKSTIALFDGSTLTTEAIFVAPRFRPTDELLRSLVCAVDPTSGLIGVDATGRTSVPGIWAADNVVTPSAHVITAAGAGSTSAIAINGWVLEGDLDAASSAH